ncbi:MAG TPA: aminoacyl-histidine dipeptidase [Mobilitalea sp.]|nr:aminoacyl-histidine dipeptidase [Mobilitalea sp.]
MDYKGIFKYFSEISKIPRGSGNEKAISDYLVSFAKEHQLEYTQDSANNVVIVKNATSGYENEPAIILQGHMDMVCEKLKEGTHDFLKDPIKLVVDGDYLHADGTTLGADDGIAVAYMMALLSDETAKHPRLEAVITTDEEVGMNGAKALDLSKLQGKFMINLDSEEEGFVQCSCAGGLMATSVLPINRVSEQGKKVKIAIGGLKGGHSGMDIDKKRTNAMKLMGRLLFDLREKSSFGLIDMQGGFKDNVIPREANAELLITAEAGKDLSEVFKTTEKNITELMTVYQKELAASEPDLNFKVEDLGDDTYEVLHPVSFEKLLFILVHMPFGVQNMSSEIDNLVESSLNLGIFKMEGDKAEFCNSVRSSKASYKQYLNDKLSYMINFLGGDYYVRHDYPAWEYKKDSPLRNHFQRLYKEQYGKDMTVLAIHAGLECGLIIEKLPDIDAVSIGPNTYRVHTIDEKVSISSVVRVYKFLEKILEEKIRA